MTQSTEHLEENVLALYVLHAPEVDGRRQEIAAHLEHCVGCAKLLEEIEGYYTEVDALQSPEAQSLLPSLSVSERLERKRGDRDAGPVTPFKRPMMQKFVASFRTYPVRWSGAFALLAAALVLLVPKFFASDANPMYARATHEFLIALNRYGEELWRTYVAPDFEVTAKQTATAPKVIDVDGDGRREILVMTSPDRLHGWIACYSGDGVERWRHEFAPKMEFGKSTFSSDYYLDGSFAVIDPGKHGRYMIAFSAHHSAWWPCAVGLLDAKDGSPLGEYWHPGWLRIQARDVDGDSTEEILAVGYNNAFKKNVLVVLDPRQITGHAPATAEYTPKGIGAASEKFYILLPDPDLFGLSLRLPAEGSSGIQEGAPLEIRTIRFLFAGKLGDRVAEMFFSFDNEMRCIKVRGGDEYVDLHRGLEKEGKIKSKLDEEYFEGLRREVRYWDGEEFVKEVTMNKKYVSRK